MKQYICLNHGECNWADETPPREFPLPDGEDQFCPNCDSTNIKEKPKPPPPPWLKIAGAVGLLILLLGIIWYWLRPDPLKLKAESNCETGLITLTAEGGDGSPVIYSAENLKPTQEGNVFKIPISKPNGSTFTFFAVQNEKRAEVQYKTDCPTLLPPPPPPPPGDSGTDPKKPVTPVVKWVRVPGSEFCVSNCVQTYNETDNLGHTRERKVENCVDCQMEERP